MKYLKAGNLDLIYRDGFIRRFMHGNDEVLRMIYFAYRDESWKTLPFRITGERISATDSSFAIDYTGTHYRDDEEFIEWKCRITGEESGKIKFSITGKVLRDLRRNRIGFCVLHPLKEVKNTICEITDPGNKKTEGRFPVTISPETPFVNIASMKWKIREDWFRLTFTGDVFETEDQRNWGDGSFKTYCTPSALPKPVHVKAGEVIHQEIIFDPASGLKKKSPRPSVVTLTPSSREIKIPLLGIGESEEPLSARAIEKLKKIGFDHYRVEVHPSSDGWVESLSASWQNAFSLGLPLELVVHLSDKNFMEEAQAVVQLCLQNRVRLFSLLLVTEGKVVTDAPVIRQIHGIQDLAGIKTGAGTNFNFTEINRNRFDNHDFGFLSFGLHPQEHAFDDMTVMENIEAHHDIVYSAKAIYGKEMAIHVSPVTLRKRFNPYTNDPSERVRSDEERNDPRQLTPFAAAWTFGSILSLAEADCFSATFFQTAGKQGIVSADGSPYPVYHVLEEFAGHQGSSCQLLESDQPGDVQAITLGNIKTGIVNFTENTKTVRLADQVIEMNPLEIKFLQDIRRF